MKLDEKKLAINLRKQGLTYNEILKQVPVAKSSLSLWLRDVGLAKRQKQRITKKRREAQLKGAKARRDYRERITKQIKLEAIKKIGKISDRDLWMLGIALYWGEGSKERKQSSLVSLGNSDPNLIRLYLQWLIRACNISKQDIVFRIYLHESSRDRLLEVRKYWKNVTGFSMDRFEKVSYKKYYIKDRRTKRRDGYYGLLKIDVKRSINLNRKIAGWIEGCYKNI